MSQSPIIVLSNICKQYKSLNRREGLGGTFLDLFSRNYRCVDAVKDVSMEIYPGEILGFIGPNGAGKSTTIKMMTGVLLPTSGELLVNGLTPFKHRKINNKSIGVVFGQRSQLWWDLPVIESFKILRDMYLIPNKDYEANLDTFNSLVDITHLYKQPVRQLSLGQRMICDIFAAFLHNPKIVFLDEPTIGLDVSVKASVREIIRTLNRERNTTIILTSHDLSDIESLSQRLIIIDKGEKMYDGALKNITKRFSAHRTLRIDVSGDRQAFIQRIKNGTGQEGALVDDGWIEIKAVGSSEEIMNLVSLAISTGEVRDLTIQGVKTEDIVRQLYDGTKI